jgi:hypothetical protein
MIAAAASTVPVVRRSAGEPKMAEHIAVHAPIRLIRRCTRYDLVVIVVLHAL